MLSLELPSVGTVPTVAHGRRLCTFHHKSFSLTRWVALGFGERDVR